MEYRVPPTFLGYIPSESVIKFLDDLKLSFTICTLTNVQKLATLEAVLRGPAKTAYEKALTDSVIAKGSGTDAEAAAETTLKNALAWLRTIYHIAEIQQSLRDQIHSMYQGMNKSLLTFYTKIQHVVGLAGYTKAVQE